MKKKKEDFGDELAERFLNFAVRIIKLTGALPKTPAGKHIADQLLRCGTSDEELIAIVGKSIVTARSK